MTRQGLSWKDKLKYTIDQVIKVSEDFDDFLAKCKDLGVLVEYDPDHKIDLKYMLAEQKERNPRARFTRSRTLGWFYETEQIKSRIAQYGVEPEEIRNAAISAYAHSRNLFPLQNNS